MAVINPKLGKFNVTAKGGLVESSYFDARIARPYLLLLLLNLGGLVAGGVRLAMAGSAGEINTIWMNIAWTVYNMFIIGAVIATSTEQRQIRRSHRVPLDMPAVLQLPDGTALPCRTVDFSTGGMAIQLDEPRPVEPGTPVHIVLSSRGQSMPLPAEVRQDRDRGGISLEFSPMSLEQERWLVTSTFARADIWIQMWGRHDRDTPLRSLIDVLKASLRGFHRLGRFVASGGRLGAPAKPRTSGESA